MKNRVVVVGAGYAGLTAALALADAGIDAEVFEARDRVGGRAYSVTTAQGAAVDLGGQWLGRPHERLLALAARFGEQTQAAPAGAATLIDGTKRYGSGASLALRAPRMVWGLQSALARLEGLSKGVDPARPWASPDAEELDARSLAEWVGSATRHPLARELLHAMVAVNVSADTSEVSLLGVLADVSGAGGVKTLLGGAAEEWVFSRGADKVAESIAASLGSAVHLETPVQRIEQTAHGVRLHGTGWEREAERVVLAVPPRFAARLLGEEASHRARMHSGGVLKAVAVYENDFWRADGHSGQTVSLSGDGGNTLDVSRGGQGMLATLIVGRRAQQLDALSPQQRHERLCDIFAGAVGEAGCSPIEVHQHSWASDPWTAGGYGELAPPGLLTSIPSRLDEPHGRVHFAGTETSPAWRGYLEGAVRSGERAAAEVVAALSHAQKEQRR